MPAAIHKVARHTFLSQHILFPDARYRHRDLAAKFLYIELSNAIPNTKKSYLDDFVKAFRKWHKEGVDRQACNVPPRTRSTACAYTVGRPAK